jgi:hypothetical protein
VTTKAAVVLELDGSGRLVSNVGPHSAEPTNFVVLRDAYVDRAKRIRKRPGTATIGTVTVTATSTLHEYVHVDPTTGLETQFILLGAAGALYRWNGAAWAAMTVPPHASVSGAWVFCNAENRCFAVNGARTMIYLDGGEVPLEWRLVGVETPVIRPTYSLAAGYSTGTTVNVTKGSAAVYGTIPAIWPVTWAGKHIDIDGVRYVIESVTTTGDGMGVAPLAMLTTSYKEDSHAARTYMIYSGLMDWTEPPVYAYSYYNPTTGHVSSRSPWLEISQKHQVGRTPTITIAADSTHQAAYQKGYSRIVVYRTQKDGGILTAILPTVDGTVVVNNVNSSVTAINFSETSATFADMHLSFYDAPITNGPAPERALSVAWW